MVLASESHARGFRIGGAAAFPGGGGEERVGLAQIARGGRKRKGETGRAGLSGWFSACHGVLGLEGGDGALRALAQGGMRENRCTEGGERRPEVHEQ